MCEFVLLFRVLQDVHLLVHTRFLSVLVHKHTAPLAPHPPHTRLTHHTHTAHTHRAYATHPHGARHTPRTQSDRHTNTRSYTHGHTQTDRQRDRQTESHNTMKNESQAMFSSAIHMSFALQMRIKQVVSRFVPREICQLKSRSRKEYQNCPRNRRVGAFSRTTGFWSPLRAAKKVVRTKEPTWRSPGGSCAPAARENTMMSDERQGQQGLLLAPIHENSLLMSCSIFSSKHSKKKKSSSIPCSPYFF